MRLVLPDAPKRTPRLLLVVAPLLAAIGCGGGEPILDCEPVGDARPICGFKNPEDLVLLGDDRTVVVSQFGSMTEAVPGSLALFDLESEEHVVVYPKWEGDASPVRSVALPGWGDAGCPGPPGDAFNPHGIDLAARPDGRLQLLVVNHGGRESIEFFEVTREGAGWSIDWRGCAIAPDEAYFNDVAGLADGGFVVSHMMPRSNWIWGLIRASFGSDTGFVYEWQPGRGFQAIEGTDAPFPNGVAVSPSGEEIFVNAYSAGEVRRHARATGELLGSVEIASPDNLSWAQDGRLLVASHVGGFSDQMLCTRIKEGACPLAFEIVALDPQELRSEVIYHNEGPPMGAGTVAIDIGDGLLIGSFVGDRVLRVRR